MNSQRTRAILRTGARLLLGALLAFAGIAHLTWLRAEFRAQVPPWVPVSIDLVVVLSGIAEITLGVALLLLPRWQGHIGWLVAAFFIVVFPGNIAQLTEHRNAFGLNSDRAREIRLCFQPLLIIWAVWSTGAWRDFRQKRKTN